jgi:flagellar hook-associated protein 2
MANISSVGIGSGVLTSDLIDKLVAAERAPTEARLDAKEEDITTELSVFGQIQSSITDLRLASRSLADPSLFRQWSVSSGSTAFSAVADNDAVAGNYTLEVSDLATAHSLSTGIFADADATQVGTGTLSFTIAGVTTEIDIDGTNNTLNGIAAAINENEELAVNASVIYTAGGYQLVLTSEDTGVDNAMQIAVTDTGDGNNTDALGLSRLSYTAGGLNLTENQSALDASFSLNGIAITRSSNTIDDVLSGVTLTLSGTNAGSPAALVIAQDSTTVIEKVEEFVDKYNALNELIREHTQFNPDDASQNGVLLGDSSTRSIFNRIQGLLGQSIAGLAGSSVQSLAEVGIATDKDDGSLTFNSTTFASKFNADPESVEALFADQGRTSDGQIGFDRATASTKVGTYAVEITQLATRGAVTGTVALAGSTLIDTDNDTFTLSVDGVASGTITLAAGTYTNSELAAHLQDRINADSNLSDAGLSVAVSVDASDRLVISSATYGSTSTVSFAAVDTDTAAELGFSVGKGAFQGNVDLTNPTVIDSDSDTFTISVDGVSSNAITLTAASYTPNDLAQHIEDQINADANLIGAGATVDVSIDSDGRLVIAAATFGTTSTVAIESVDTDSATLLGLDVREGGDGVDVAGTINGVAATGSGQFLTAAAGDDSDGIRLEVSGGALGSRGTVTYMEGVAEQMVDLINSLLGADGTVFAKNERLNLQLEGIAEERVKLNLRIESLTERLVRQFTAADIIVARLNSTMDFVSKQLDALLSSNNNE